VATGFGDLARNLRELAQDAMPRREELQAVADRLVPEVAEAVRATPSRGEGRSLADQSMSGWRRGKPILIAGTAFVRKGSIMVTRNKESAGMMRVLDDGRNRGDAGGFAGPGVSADGTTRRTKAGNVRKVANRSKLVVGDGRVRRKWNGPTEGKNTWTHALNRMESAAPTHVPNIILEELADRIVKVVSRG